MNLRTSLSQRVYELVKPENLPDVYFGQILALRPDYHDLLVFCSKWEQDGSVLVISFRAFRTYGPLKSRREALEKWESVKSELGRSVYVLDPDGKEDDQNLIPQLDEGLRVWI